MRKLFGIVKAKGGKHRLQTAKLLGVWQQARTRNDTKQNIKAAGRAHELPLELLHGGWRNLFKALASTHGPKTPKNEMPACSYSDHLEEVIQDGLLRAETVLRIVCLESEELHLISNGAETSHHVAMYSTLMSKKRLTSSQPVDIESFRMNYATFLNVWRMLCLRTPGRPVLQGVTGATWEGEDGHIRL